VPSSCGIGVGDEVVGRRRLQDRGQDRGLGDRQLAQVRDAEVALAAAAMP
jgi:hypothetical protein